MNVLSQLFGLIYALVLYCVSFLDCVTLMLVTLFAFQFDWVEDDMDFHLLLGRLIDC